MTGIQPQSSISETSFESERITYEFGIIKDNHLLSQQ